MIKETLNNTSRICPYCGDSYQPESEDYSEDYSEDLRIEQCENCGNKYYARDTWTVTHWAKPSCPLNDKPHVWRDSKHADGYSICMRCGDIKIKQENE